MGRRVDNQKRRDLARRAVSILHEEGLDMSMAKLAEALGMKRPTLLYYFPDRASIAETALEDVLLEQARYVINEMMKHEHPLDQIFAQITAIHRFHDGREQRLIFLAQAIAAAGRERMTAFIDIGNRGFETQRDAMVKRIREAVDAGIMKPCDPVALMQLVRSVNDGLMVQRVMTGIDLAPVHKLLWEQLLLPLKTTPEAIQ